MKRYFLFCGLFGTTLTASGMDRPDDRSAGRADDPSSSMMYLDRIPLGILEQTAETTKSIGYPGLAWREPEVTVAFNGGNPQLYALIEATAKEWTSNGGHLTFSFRRKDGSYRTWREVDVQRTAAVRIGFFTDENRKGYWSVIGALAKRVNAGDATMNFGDLGTTLSAYYSGKKSSEWLQSYAHSVILHEFGHALGLNHEHFHPQCQPDLDLDATVAWLMGSPNGWLYEQAMFNMDAKTYFEAMKAQAGQIPLDVSPAIDRASVMLYSFGDGFYRSGSTSPCRPVGDGPRRYATTLSAGDRAYYRANYPLPTG